MRRRAARPGRTSSRPPTPRVRLDDELLALYRDDPELLVLADAVAATQRATDWRRRRGSGLIAAVAAAAIAAVAVMLTDETRTTVVDDARAALAAGPVLRAVVARPVPSDVIVDIARGTTTPTYAETAIWFDSETGRVRVAGRRNGEGVSIDAASETPATRFLAAYHDALVKESIDRVSSANRSFVINARGITAVVTLGDDDLPISFRPLGGRSIRFARFDVAEAVPMLSPVPSSSAVTGPIISKQATTPAGAARRAQFRPLAPPRLAKLPRRRVLFERLASTAPDGARVTSGVAAVYSDGRRFVTVRQSRSRSPAYGFAQGRTLGGNPVPRSPRVDVRRGAGVVHGQFLLGGLYVTIRASDKALVVAAARQLRAVARCRTERGCERG